MVEVIKSDVAVMESFLDRMAQFLAFSQEIGKTVESHMQTLHSTWAGGSAEAQRDFHQQWQYDLDILRHDAEILHRGVTVARDNIVRVEKFHTSLWPKRGSSEG